MVTSSATQPTSPGYTYGALVNGIIAHPLFPLIIKKVFDVCHSNAFERSHLIPHFTETEGSATGLQNFARQHGLSAACERWASTDVFMSALVASLNQVSSTGAGDNVALRHTIAAGQTALSAMWTDPRYVGATDAGRDSEEVQNNDPGLREDIAPRPSSSGEVVDSVQRSDEQPSSGTQTRRATTRIALSDKARQTLERWFQEHISSPYPTKQEKEELAALCDICLSSVNNWFGNKRMRVKRKMLQVKSQQREEQRITDKVLAPKSKWNAVVVSKIGSQAGRDALKSATGASISVQPAPDEGRDEHSVLKRGEPGPSVIPPTTKNIEQVGESSEMIRPRRSRRRQGQPGLSTFPNPAKASVPELPPARDSIDIPRGVHLFPSQIHIGLPVLPRTTSITGQVRDGIEVCREGQALQSQPKNGAGISVLPGTVDLTGRIRDGAKVYREGQSLPPMGPIRPSVLPSAGVTTEQVRNSSAVCRGEEPLPPHSLGGIPRLQTTAPTEETQSNVETSRETNAMRTRKQEGPLTIQPAATQDQTQQARKPPRHTAQFTAARGPSDSGSTVQHNREFTSSQTRGQTEQTQHEARGGQAGPSRSTRRTKRRKLA